MRLGEVLGLKRKMRIDDYVVINNSPARYINGKMVDTPPKRPLEKRNHNHEGFIL